MSVAAVRQAETTHPAAGRIPVLDIGPFLAGEPGAAAPLARAIARTCEDTGFLVVANHGVPQPLAEAVFDVAAKFFARPEAEKLPHKIGESEYRLPAVWRADRAAFAGQPEHQAEFQRELLHHPRPRARPPRHRQQKAADRPQPLAGRHARVPRRDDGLLRRDGGDDDAAGAGLRDGARTCRRTISPRPSPSRTARSG